MKFFTQPQSFCIGRKISQFTRSFSVVAYMKFPYRTRSFLIVLKVSQFKKFLYRSQNYSTVFLNRVDIFFWKSNTNVFNRIWGSDKIKFRKSSKLYTKFLDSTRSFWIVHSVSNSQQWNNNTRRLSIVHRVSV